MDINTLAERILICGDKDWRNLQLILDTLSKIQQERGVEVVIVGLTGNELGAGRLGIVAAERLGIPIEVHRSDWRKHGLNADAVRNGQMLHEGRPTYVLAFHNYIENSKGTKDMVNVARNAGVPAEIITERK